MPGLGALAAPRRARRRSRVARAQRVIHAQQHLGPVLRVGAARARVAPSQIASRSSCSPVNSARSSSRSSSRAQRRRRRRRSRARPSRRPPRAPSSNSVSRSETRAVEPVDELDVVAARATSSVVTLRAAVGVVPEVGLAAPRPRAPPIRPAPRRRAGTRGRPRRGGAARRGRRRSHAWVRRRRGQRPWQSLYFLPLPQKHGSLRPGVFSTRTGCIDLRLGAATRLRRVVEVAGELLGRHRRRGRRASRPRPAPGPRRALYCSVLRRRRARLPRRPTTWRWKT